MSRPDKIVPGRQIDKRFQFDFDCIPNIKQTICESFVYLLSIFYRPRSAAGAACVLSSLQTRLNIHQMYSTPIKVLHLKAYITGLTETYNMHVDLQEPVLCPA